MDFFLGKIYCLEAGPHSKLITFQCELLKNSPDMSADPLLMLCEVLKKRKEKKSSLP